MWQTSQLSTGYPASPGGQESFYNDALSILAQVPHHLAQGLFYWEPEWIPGVGWEPGAGTPNDNLTLFSFTGKALPSVGLFPEPAGGVRALRPVVHGGLLDLGGESHNARIRLLRALCSTSASPSASSTGGT